MLLDRFRVFLKNCNAKIDFFQRTTINSQARKRNWYLAWILILIAELVVYKLVNWPQNADGYSYKKPSTWISLIPSFLSAAAAVFSATAAWFTAHRNFFRTVRSIRVVVTFGSSENLNPDKTISGSGSPILRRDPPYIFLIMNLGNKPEAIMLANLTTKRHDYPGHSHNHDGIANPQIIKPGDSIALSLYLNRPEFGHGFEDEMIQVLQVFLVIGLLGDSKTPGHVEIPVGEVKRDSSFIPQNLMSQWIVNN